MVDATVDDVNRIDATLGGIECRRDLGQHATRQRAIGKEFVDSLGRQAGQQIAFLVEHTDGVGHHDQLFGLEHLGHLAGHQIGIDVVGLAALARTDRRNHRNEAVGGQGLDDRGVDRLDLAHLADVDLGAGRIAALDQHLAGAHQSAVLAGEAHALTAGLIDQLDDFLVDLTGEHHLDDVHGLFVGDPHALHELALLADPGKQLFDLRPAAMHHDRIDADQLEQHHIVGEAALQTIIGHGVAAVLHHHRAAMKTADIGQRLGKDFGFDGGGQVIAHGSSDAGWTTPPMLTDEAFIARR